MHGNGISSDTTEPVVDKSKKRFIVLYYHEILMMEPEDDEGQIYIIHAYIHGLL